MPGLEPVGQTLLRNNPPPVTVIGVVDDAADVSVAEPQRREESRHEACS